MSARLGFRLAFVLLWGLEACSISRSFTTSAASYRGWVESRLEVERLYDRGKQLFAAQVLPADDELKARQEDVAPGFSFTRDPSKRQLVVAVTAFSRRDLSPLDIVWQLGGQNAVRVAEIKSSAVHERLYSFAYPFYRVFILDFEPTASGAFEIRSPYGRVVFPRVGE